MISPLFWSVYIFIEEVWISNNKHVEVQVELVFFSYIVDKSVNLVFRSKLVIEIKYNSEFWEISSLCILRYFLDSQIIECSPDFHGFDAMIGNFSANLLKNI